MEGPVIQTIPTLKLTQAEGYYTAHQPLVQSLYLVVCFLIHRKEVYSQGIIPLPHRVFQSGHGEIDKVMHSFGLSLAYTHTPVDIG